MFSAALEMVLNVALREALQRRHGHLTLEHLLYAVANHPAGEEILRACAVDLDRLRAELSKFLDESVERLPRGKDQEPTQTLAFRRVLQTAVLHVQSAGREEAHVGDVLAAMQQLARDGMTMIVVTHEMGFAREVADTVVFMDAGVVVESGKPADVLSNPSHERTRAFLSKVL